MDSKKCNKCKEIKEYSAFSKNKNAKDGLQHNCMVCNRNYCKTYYKSGKGKAGHYIRSYGLEQEAYTLFLLKQKGCCAICKTPEKETARRILCVDHCHKTNVVRGLLCDPCNRGLGTFKDNINSLENAIRYLEASQWAE